MRDVAVVAQRLEMVTRIAREIEDYVLELGTDGRLLSLQLEELVTGVDAERELVIRDYLPAGRRTKSPEELLQRLEALSATELVDPAAAAAGARPRHRRAPRRRGRAARLPAAGQGAAAAHRGRRPAGRPLRHPAEAALGRHRRPPGRRGRRRAARPQRPRGPLPPGRVDDPRALRLSGPLGSPSGRSARRVRGSVGASELRVAARLGACRRRSCRTVSGLVSVGLGARRDRPGVAGASSSNCSSAGSPARAAAVDVVGPGQRPRRLRREHARRSAGRSRPRRRSSCTSRRTTTSRARDRPRALPARPDVVLAGGDLEGQRVRCETRQVHASDCSVRRCRTIRISPCGPADGRSSPRARR